MKVVKVEAPPPPVTTVTVEMTLDELIALRDHMSNDFSWATSGQLDYWSDLYNDLDNLIDKAISMKKGK